jgi:uncharacterized membrane protein
MTVEMDPRSAQRLEELEHRVRTLEQELADLRVFVVPEPEPEPEPVPEPRDLRRRLAELDVIRERAVWKRDLDALADLRRLLSELEPDFAAAGLGSSLAALRRAVDDGITFLEVRSRKPAEPSPPAVPPRREPARPPTFELPSMSFSDLLGARALAIAGGIVTLLGIVFFFVLAVNRGWIGPGGRVALGGIAAALVYGGGLWLRRRYGETYSSLAAVAAGIAGAYMVLLAAAALYHFVDDLGALVIAAAIAAVGLVTALRWQSQIVAGIGLLGAMLVPLAVVPEHGMSALGTAFVAFMAAATAIVCLRQRWDVLLVVSAVTGLSQALALVLQDEYRGRSPAQIVAIAAVFAAITVGTGLGAQLRARSADLGALTTTFLFAGTAFAVLSALRLYGSTESRGTAVLVVALALGTIAAAYFPRRSGRDLSALLAALGLVVGGIAFAELMSGSPLAYAWAGEAAVLAWLARRVKDLRYQLWGLVYLAAALIHVLAFDAPPSHLFKPLETSAAGALAVVAVGASAALVAHFAARRRIQFGKRGGFYELLVPFYDGLGASQPELRVGGALLAGLAAVYAASLGVLAAVPSFDWGHVAMYGFWSAIGLAAYTLGLRSGEVAIRVGGALWLVLTVVAAIAHGERMLAPDPRSVALFVAGAALLGAVLAELFLELEPRYERLGEERELWLLCCWVAVAGAVASLSLGLLAAIPSYDWGHFAVYALWSALGLAVFAAALVRSASQIRIGAVVGLGVTGIAAFWQGEKAIGADARPVTFFVVGAALLAVALLDQLLPRRQGLKPVAFAFVLGSVGLGLGALVALDQLGLALLGLAALYGVLAAAAFRIEGQRDLSTLLWGTALVLGYGASDRLLPGTLHAVTLAIAAAALAWIARRVREPRFLAAAAVVLLVDVATALIRLAPPTHLFRAQAHPGNGAVAVLVVAVAAAVVATLAGRATELRRRGHDLGWWMAGTLAVYGLSLLVLELFQRAFGASIQTDFQRGHTAVSAFWGLVGLGLLYFGLTRLGALRVAGFALFAVSLAKIFLYDLPSLSSITRALSFLAVGAVLLLGGFFYQRLASPQTAGPTGRRHERLPALKIGPQLGIALALAAALVIWFGAA